MTEILCSGQVDALNLSQLLTTCQRAYASEEMLLLIEQLPTHVIDARERQGMLRFEIYKSATNVTAYTSGRLFRHDFELRWKRRNALFHIVYLGSDYNKATLDDFNLKEDPTFWRLVEDQQLEYREKRYYLFGEVMQDNGLPEGAEARQGKSFAEARIPRILYYPVQAASRYVRLVVREYLRKETGEIEYFRFQSLEPAAEH